MKKTILILGAGGMLGSTLFRAFQCNDRYNTFGTLRQSRAIELFETSSRERLFGNIAVEGEAGLLSVLSKTRPDVVINCIGIIKQLPEAAQHLETIEINAKLPHRLAAYCGAIGARLIHFSTDCVFSGEKGNYQEADIPDADDLYGRTKYLGEVAYGNAITLRTSIIGHELSGHRSLLQWFLGESGEVKGYRKAIFSGLPTVEVARVLHDYVIPNEELRGLFHLSVDPINKYDLLKQIAMVYEKQVSIIPDESMIIDRSLDSSLFQRASGYVPRKWDELIQSMHEDHVNTRIY